MLDAEKTPIPLPPAIPGWKRIVMARRNVSLREPSHDLDHNGMGRTTGDHNAITCGCRSVLLVQWCKWLLKPTKSMDIRESSPQV